MLTQNLFKRDYAKRKKMPGEQSSDDPISNPDSRFKVEVFFKYLDTRTNQMHERFKNLHSNFKKVVCLQPEGIEQFGSSDVLKELTELYKDGIDSSDDVLQEYRLLCNMFRMWKREAGFPAGFHLLGGVEGLWGGVA